MGVPVVACASGDNSAAGCGRLRKTGRGLRCSFRRSDVRWKTRSTMSSNSFGFFFTGCCISLSSTVWLGEVERSASSSLWEEDSFHYAQKSTLFTSTASHAAALTRLLGHTHTYSDFFLPNMRPMLFLLLFLSLSGDDTFFHSSGSKGDGETHHTIDNSVCYKHLKWSRAEEMQQAHESHL